MGTMDDYARLGEQLKAARTARRPRISQTDAAAALGVGRSTIQKMESGGAGQVTPTTLRAYAQWLGWSADSIERVLAGGDPVPAEETQHALSDAVPDASLPPDIEYELREGRVLGGQVFNLGPDDSDGQIIVLYQGRKDATPEEVERIAARYRQARRYLQNMGVDTDRVADN